jgi:ferredoxin
MKASPWEVEDTIKEDIPFMNNLSPKEYVIKDGKLVGMMFEQVTTEELEGGKAIVIPTGEPDVFVEADDVVIAIGQDATYPWIEEDLGLELGDWGQPIVDKKTFQSTLKQVFFGGDAAFGPANIITAVAHGHQAAVSIDLFCENKDISDRPDPMTNLIQQKMGIHEWIYDSPVDNDLRYKVPHAEKEIVLKNLKAEVELGFDTQIAFKEASRCLNCDVQTIFSETKCIECDACVDVCPTSCITFTKNGTEEDLRNRLTAPAENTDQDLYVSKELPTERVMIKDEDVCLHCGLCAERCPTAAWDMLKFDYTVTKTLCKI